MSQKDSHDVVIPDLTAPPPARKPYVPPTVEALGDWKVLTLGQTVPVVLGGVFPPFVKNFRE